MLHIASLGSRLDYFNSVLRHVKQIFKGYRECRMHELFAKLHDAIITQPTFLRISIGYMCEAAVLCYKAVKLQQPSHLTLLSTLSIYCRLSRVLGSSASDLLPTQSSSTNVAARRFSCCAPTVWKSSLI